MDKNFNPFSRCTFSHVPKTPYAREEYMDYYIANNLEIGTVDNWSDDRIEFIAKKMAAIRIADANVKNGDQ